MLHYSAALLPTLRLLTSCIHYYVLQPPQLHEPSVTSYSVQQKLEQKKTRICEREAALAGVLTSPTSVLAPSYSIPIL